MTRLVFLFLTIITCALSAKKPVLGKCGENNAMAIGPCRSGKNGPCGHNGYACDATFSKCCPIVNTVDTQYRIGPAIGGLCPIGYVAIYGLPKDTSGNGTCIDLRSSDE